MSFGNLPFGKLPFGKLFEETILPRVALSKYDALWAEAMDGSILFRLWLGLKKMLSSFLSFPKIGSFLQLSSFVLVAVLFLILPAPQFAEDKGKLAILILAAFSLRVFGALIGGKERYKPTTIDGLVIAFAGINIIATLGSHYLSESVKGLMKMAVYFVSYFLFVSSISFAPKRRGLIVVAALLSAGFLISCHGLYQYKIGVAPLATWEDPNVEDKTTRIYSFLRNPNLLAGYLVPLIPVSLGVAIMALLQDGWRRLIGLPLLGVSGIITLACVLTGSRGGWLGIGVGLGAMAMVVVSSIWFAKPKLRAPILVAVLMAPIALIGVLHFFPAYEHRIRSILDFEHSSNRYRMNVYASSIRMFLDSWWIGVGPGNSTFKLAYGLYMKTSFDALGTYCVPLEVAVETGVIGLFIFIWLIVASVARAHMNFWNKFAGPEKWICAGAAAGLLAMMMHGMVDTVFYRPQVQFIFWLLIALCTCLIPRQPATTNESANNEAVA